MGRELFAIAVVLTVFSGIACAVLYGLLTLVQNAAHPTPFVLLLIFSVAVLIAWYDDDARRLRGRGGQSSKLGNQ